jgi:4-O-beta-D-mannosyl-D-glucose phosphorylase
MTALDDPARLIHEPGADLLAPDGGERLAHIVSHGWAIMPDGRLLIYHASSETRCHVAATTVAQLVDHCKDTPRDPLRSFASVQQRIGLIRRNLVTMRAAYPSGV